MKLSKIITAVFCICFVTNASAQTFLLNKNAKGKNRIHATLDPGITPQGERLLQFLFYKSNKFDEKIQTDSLGIVTTSGNIIYLKNPMIDTSYQSDKYSITWRVSYVLSPENISIVKSDKIVDLILFVNHKRKVFKIPSSKSIEINDIAVKHF